MVRDTQEKLSNIKSIRFGKNKGLNVVEQPKGQRGFVSPDPDVITNFKMANQQGVYGFIAHNYLAGKKFFELKPGHVINLTDEDGADHNFRVKEIQRYQAVDPRNPRSDFINLEDNKTCSATDLFNRVYRGNRRLILQTCISKDGNDEWGRMFIVAERMSRRKPHIPN